MARFILALGALAVLTPGCGKSAVGVASGGRDVVGQWTIDVEKSAILQGTEFNRRMVQITDRKVWYEVVKEVESRPVVEFFEDGRFKFMGAKDDLEGLWSYVSSGDVLSGPIYELQTPDGKQPVRLGYREDRLHDLNPNNPGALVFRRFTGAAKSSEASAPAKTATSRPITPSTSPAPTGVAPAIPARSPLDVLVKLDHLGPLMAPELSRGPLPFATSLNAVSLSADGRRALAVGHSSSGSFHGVAHLIDATTGELVQKEIFSLPQSEIYQGALLAPDGKRALLWAKNGLAQLVDLDSKQELFRLPHDAALRCAAFSADGRLLATGEGSQKGLVRVWDTASGALRRRFDNYPPGIRGIIGLRFAREPVSLHVCNGVEIATLDIDSGELRSRFAIDAAGGWEFASFTPDGRRAAVAYATDAAVWDLEQGKQVARFKVSDSLAEEVYLSANSGWLVAGSGLGKIGIWEVASGNAITRFECKGLKAGFSISADERTLLTGADNHVRAWSLPSSLPQPAAEPPAAEFKVGEILKLQPAPGRHTADALQFLPDGKRAIVSSMKHLFVYDLADGRSVGVEEMRGHTGDAGALDVAGDGRTIVSGGQDKTLRVWDRATTKQTALLAGHLEPVECAAISSDGKLALSATKYGDNQIWLWDVPQQRVKQKLAGHTSRIITLAFLPGDQKAVSFDGKVAVAWDLNTGKHLATVEISKIPVDKAAFSADGKRAVFGGLSAVQLWDMEKGRMAAALPLTIGQTLWDVAMSADGRLAVLLAGNSLTAYDVTASKEVAKINVPQSTSKLELSRDGRYALTGGINEITLWGLPEK